MIYKVKNTSSEWQGRIRINICSPWNFNILRVLFVLIEELMHVSFRLLVPIPRSRKKKFGRHFGTDDELVSHISRKSIDVLKANYRESFNKCYCLSFFLVPVKLRLIFFFFGKVTIYSKK